VYVPKFLDDLGTLCAFAGTWSSKHKKDNWLLLARQGRLGGDRNDGALWIRKPLLHESDGSLRVRPDVVDRPRAVERVHEPLVPKVLDDGHRVVLEGEEALLDRLHVVVASAARLTALKQPRLKHRLAHLIHQDAGHVQRSSNRLLPPGQVVRVARETVDQKAFAAIFLYRGEQ